MLKFPHHKPFRSYSHTMKCWSKKIVLPRWYSRLDLDTNSYASDAIDIKCFRQPVTIKVGKYTSLGSCTFVVDGDHAVHYASTYPFKEFGLSKTAPDNKGPEKAPPAVGNDVWIGDDAYIYAGVVVNDGAVVAGNSVVTKSVPPYAVVAGNPARIVKYRFSEEMIQRFLDVQWWHFPDEFVHGTLGPLIADPEEFLKAASEFSMKK